MPILAVHRDQARAQAQWPCAALRRFRLPHVHRFRWSREDPFSPHNVYACRCGVARHGL